MSKLCVILGVFLPCNTIRNSMKIFARMRVASLSRLAWDGIENKNMDAQWYANGLSPSCPFFLFRPSSSSWCTNLCKQKKSQKSIFSLSDYARFTHDRWHAWQRTYDTCIRWWECKPWMIRKGKDLFCLHKVRVHPSDYPRFIYPWHRGHALDELAEGSRFPTHGFQIYQ